MTADGPDERMRAILAEAGVRFGVPVGDAELLWSHSNALYAVPAESLVIRIATNPHALPRVISSVAVTRWLDGQGYPCVVPADLPGHPRVIRGHVVSLWRYVETVTAPEPGGDDLGRLLHRLHHLDPRPVRDLGEFTDPLAGVAAAVTRSNLPGRDRTWLEGRIGDLRAAWNGLAPPHPPTLIHGDAHPANLMRAASGRVILGDWDHVALGSREWDLAQIHYTRRRFDHPGAAEVEAFTRAYRWDVREWPGLETLIAIREISGLSAFIRAAAVREPARREVAHRLAALRDGDTEARWHPPGG
ncbi:phosphotransferase family protein [Spongiactinospora rosea]|uniref:phosphotransferase family protein n=1 Tax=Spongiactinospora rosea TaxID=2248750 RepID=UPI001314EF1D|nr:aminoglycoside phosphotransferase family protein [Spongiactinospora rosea]